MSRSRQSAVGAEDLPEDEPSPVSPGELVAGKYRVQKILGIGGMGVVARAEHEELGQKVALKVMRTARKTPETVERFVREARAAVRLKSSHVAKVRDVGVLPNGLPFMVMDLLEGSDLFAVLQEKGPLPVGDAIDYILQACDAISEAHEVGIIHRDIKPENLFLTQRRDGTPLVKVLDFGISKITPVGKSPESPAGRSMTHESTIIGSPSYMSPEQIRSAKTVDERTDIWALGCTLFELLTNQEAFGADNAPDIFVRVLEKPPPPIDQMRPDLPPGLEDVINKCLEKNRENRYESIDAFASALSRYSPRRSTSIAPRWRDYIQVDIDLDALDPMAAAKTPAPPIPRRKAAAQTFVLPGRPKSRRTRNVVLLAMLVLFASSGAAAFVFRDKLMAIASPPKPAPTVAVVKAPDVPVATPVPSAAASVAAAVLPSATPSAAETFAPVVVTSAAPGAAPTAAPKPIKKPLRPATTAGTAKSTSTPPSTTTAAPDPHRRTDW